MLFENRAQTEDTAASGRTKPNISMKIMSQAEIEGRGMYDMIKMHAREAVPLQAIKAYRGMEV
jgi:hypothetical protein